MTGTPLDLTPFGSVLTGLGFLYWLLAALFMWVAVRGKRPWQEKAFAASIVVFLFGLYPAYAIWGRYDALHRLRGSEELFQERCKSAGEKINRAVENVDGVLLLNVRPETKSSDRSDPNWPDAALPNEGRGDWYIRTFLFWEHHEDKRAPRGYLNEQPSDLPGYRFVDVKEPDGSVYRYQLEKAGSSALSRQLVQGKPARYAVSFENMVDPADRQRWIAGTRVKVIDTDSGDVIAEKTWYSLEPGQGSTAGFRSPWGFVVTCPSVAGWVERAPTRFFVETILKPKKGS